MEYTISSSKLNVKIASRGAEIRSVVDSETGREYMWSGDSVYWGRVSPVLFPLVGNYLDKESIYDGRTYTMGQHGFARDTEFELAGCKSDEIWFAMKSTDATREKYPFEFELQIGYQVNERELKVLWKVVNLDTKTMYFSIGAHPAFVCDLSTSHLEFKPINENLNKLNVEYLDTRSGCVSDVTKEIKLTDGKLELTPELFDDDALIIEEQVGEVSLINKDGSTVNVTFDAPVLGIWSPAGKNAPFVCIEPWYGRSDRVTFNKKLEDREWSNELGVGATFDANYTISFN